MGHVVHYNNGMNILDSETNENILIINKLTVFIL